jgi:hypothetical protein
MASNLALFCLATYLATFQKIGLFFPNHLVTLKTTQRHFFTWNKKQIAVKSKKKSLSSMIFRVGN